MTLNRSSDLRESLAGRLASAALLTLLLGNIQTEGMASPQDATAPRTAPLVPKVTTIPAPLKPAEVPEIDQSVILGRCGYYSIGLPMGTGDAPNPRYEPVEAGGFRVTGSQRYARPIISRRSTVVVGDVPGARISTYSYGGVPYWKNSDTNQATTGAGKKTESSGSPIFGTLKLGVISAAGKNTWFDTLKNVQTTHWPGYSDYVVQDPARAWTARVRIAPIVDSHSLVCRVEFEGQPQRLIWSFGGIAFDRAAPLPNHVAITGNVARLTEPKQLAGGLVLAGWDGQGNGRVVPEKRFGETCEFSADKPQSVYHLCTHWGVTDIQQHPLDVAMNNLAKNPASTWWPRGMEDLKREWRAGFVDPVRDPEGRFQALLAKPQEALDRTVSHWDKRRGEFVVHTPDKTFNAVMNFARCITEYNLQGAGYYLSAIYPKYMHISTGWYGRESGGDHASNEMNLRMYATLQFPDDKGDPPAGSLAAAADGPRPPRKGGYIGWGNWDFAPFREENNTAYWVVQVWQNYRWTARKEFLKDMWPHIVRAVDWELSNEDPDGDGLFRSDYEYWNCDSGGKGPKGAGPTAICYGMLDSAARIAHEIGEQESEKHYRKLADKTRLEANRQLWSEKYGVLGTRGSDDILRTHPQVWDEYFAVLFGLFDESQGRRAMRWLESHYGFTGDRPDVRLLSCSDWWPHRWSNHWVPVGDTLLAATAGLRGGDADRWWPYVQTVARSAFRNGFPGIGFSVANSGASGGDMEDVDALDPHPHFVVRGLFGIESDLHEDTLHICPSFPTDWTEASLKTPDVQYEYRREGQVATFRIHTPRPTVKHVRANPGAPEVVTPAEKDSVVKATLGAPIADREPPAHPPTVLSYRQPVQAAQPLTQAQRNRLIRVDLSGSYNISPEDLAGKLKFYFDHKLDEKIPSTIAGWWHTPTIEWPPMPRTLDLPDGTTYLIAGRDSHGLPEKGLLAVASWQPYPLPGGAMIPIGRMCERIYLLLQNYTHPSRCYIPNGEVVLTYADGQRKTVPLIPPFNLDCYYQPFSREGSGVKLGNLVYGQWSAVRPKVPDATANSLMIPTDPNKELKTVELRATCPETILGLAGLTILSAE